MSPRRLPIAGATKNWRRAAVALTTATVAICVSGMSIAPAQSAADGQCPSALPVGDVTGGMDVHTLTVTHGTTPDPFNGKVLGVLHDGIAPGLDMILVDFGSTDGTTTEIDKAGIWEGMSGSPVYSSDGHLLGAVAYALASGTTTIAGVTPATEMQKMLTAVPGSISTAAAGSVSVPARMARRIVASGAATATQLDGGLHPLRVPWVINGLGERRLPQLSKALGVNDVRPMGAAATGTDASNIPIVAGGNLAASISYGEVTAAGIGTATAVCNGEVLAFGHPMNFTGASTMTMHGAEALGVQPDANYSSFKLANLGAPVGTVDQDHLAGLHGLVGPAPTTSVVSSYVSVGNASRTGTTYISVPSAVPDIALANVVGDQDRELDAIGAGSGRFHWEIDMHKRNGTPIVVRRTDDFADQTDISYATVSDLANMLYNIQSGDYGVTIDSVTTSSTLSHQYLHYTVRSVQIRRHGAWHQLSQYRPVRLRAGSTARLLVTLVSKELGARTVRTDLPVPLRAGHKVATLQVTGAGSLGAGNDMTDVFASSSMVLSDGPSTQPTLDQLVQQLHSTPRHSDVLTDLTFFDQKSGAPTGLHRHARVGTDHVVDGSLTFPVVGVRSRH